MQDHVRIWNVSYTYQTLKKSNQFMQIPLYVEKLLCKFEIIIG